MAPGNPARSQTRMVISMIRTMLQAKIHSATVTASDLHYEGSCGIDAALLEAAGILPNQGIDVYNVSNGERLTTYAIVEPAGSGKITMNGAAARKVVPGDKVIICAYAAYSDEELESYSPVIVIVGSDNRQLQPRHS